MYSGTPGSGKSLDVSRRLYWWVRAGKPCICNFPLNLESIGGGKEKNFVYKSNNELTPGFLISFAKDYIAGHNGKVEEGSILFVVDEAQMLFNSRDWGQKGRGDWLYFFTHHRHFGYDVVLVSQFDRMLDRQIRCLLEYEYVHRKVTNFGKIGKILSLFCFGNLFVSVKMWYPMKEKVGSEFFRAKKFYYRIYDSYGDFSSPN